MKGSVVDLQIYESKGYCIFNIEHEESWIRIKKAERWIHITLINHSQSITRKLI